MVRIIRIDVGEPPNPEAFFALTRPSASLGARVAHTTPGWYVARKSPSFVIASRRTGMRGRYTMRKWSGSAQLNPEPLYHEDVLLLEQVHGKLKRHR